MSGIANDGKIVTITPDGNLVADRVSTLKTELLEAIKDAGVHVSIDMSKVAIIESTGIGTLITVHNALKKTNGSLRLVNVSQDICGTLAIMRLGRHFEITPKTMD